MGVRRHHYVPVTYLKSWRATDEMLRVFRKESPQKPYLSNPLRTGFEDYYYAFEKEDGTVDTDSLEAAFSIAETQWPELLDQILRKEDMQDCLNDFLEFVALQRGRVPAARDMYELMQADSLLSTAKFMNQRGMLPAAPEGFEDILDRVDISVDPQSSLKAISLALNSCERIFNLLDFGVLFNLTTTKFLTSDNPVMWFDPSVPESDMLPYNVSPTGNIELIFPISPTAVLCGWNIERDDPDGPALRYGNISDVADIERINRMVARFAYHAVFAQDTDQSELIERYSAESPVVKTTTIPAIRGQYIVGQMVFGQRRRKPKWSPSED